MLNFKKKIIVIIIIIIIIIVIIITNAKLSQLFFKLESLIECSCYAIAFQFSQCVVTFLVTGCISKRELFNW